MTAREVEPIVRFRSVVSKLTTCTLIVVVAWAALFGDYGRGHDLSSRVIVTSILTGAQILALLILMATIFTVQRRPAVFCSDDRIIDRQMNVSLWSRYSFQWCIDVLVTAGKDELENPDLPAMDHIARSESAMSRFQNMVLKENSLPLWVQIVWEFRFQLIWQWLAILLSNFFDVAPAFATLQLLQYLETRNDSDDLDPAAWKYVVGIVVATISHHGIDSRIMWRATSGMISSRTERAILICRLCRDCHSTSINPYGTNVHETNEKKEFQ